MMRLPPFRYLAPSTARGGANPGEPGPEAMPWQGGTDIYPT